MKTLWINFDRVLCDILPTWVGAYNLEACDALNVNDVTDYHWYTHTRGWSQQEVEALLETYPVYETARPRKGALTVISQLYAFGHPMRVVSQGASNQVTAKYNWLQSWFEDINFNPVWLPEWVSVQTIVGEHGLLVDTCATNCPHILMTEAHNTHASPDLYGQRVETWYDLLSLVR